MTFLAHVRVHLDGNCQVGESFSRATLLLVTKGGYRSHSPQAGTLFVHWWTRSLVRNDEQSSSRKQISDTEPNPDGTIAAAVLSSLQRGVGRNRGGAALSFLFAGLSDCSGDSGLARLSRPIYRLRG